MHIGSFKKLMWCLLTAIANGMTCVTARIISRSSSFTWREATLPFSSLCCFCFDCLEFGLKSLLMSPPQMLVVWNSGAKWRSGERRGQHWNIACALMLRRSNWRSRPYRHRTASNTQGKSSARRKSGLFSLVLLLFFFKGGDLKMTKIKEEKLWSCPLLVVLDSCILSK